MGNMKAKKIYYKFVIILDFLFALLICIIGVISYVKWKNNNVLLFILVCIIFLGVFGYINFKKLKKCN